MFSFRLLSLQDVTIWTKLDNSWKTFGFKASLAVRVHYNSNKLKILQNNLAFRSVRWLLCIFCFLWVTERYCVDVISRNANAWIQFGLLARSSFIRMKLHSYLNMQQLDVQQFLHFQYYQTVSMYSTHKSWR